MVTNRTYYTLVSGHLMWNNVETEHTPIVSSPDSSKKLKRIRSQDEDVTCMLSHVYGKLWVVVWPAILY